MPAENPCLAAALWYLELGWSPVPLCPPDCDGRKYHKTKHHLHRRGKVPLVNHTRYTDKQPTPAEVWDWWLKWPMANVGICLGGVSGLLGVDVDDLSGTEELRAVLGGAATETLTFTTGGGGYRLLYRWPEGEPVPYRQFDTSGKKLSLLGHGSQTVMPPSAHHSGPDYAWPCEAGPDHRQIAPVPVALRLAMLDTTKRKKGPPGGGFSAAKPAPKREHADWQTRAGAYIERCRPFRIKGDGSTQLLKLASGLQGTVGLTVEQTVEAILSYANSDFPEPWTESEVRRRVIDGASYKPDSEPDERFSEPGQNIEFRPAKQPDKALIYTEDYDSKTEGPTKAPEPPLQVVTLPKPSTNGHHAEKNGTPLPTLPVPQGRLASAFKQRKMQWFYPPYIPQGMLTLLVGMPGAGKSTFLGFLMSKAKRTLLLPGSEEPFDVITLARLRAAGVNLDTVLVLDRGEWTLPLRRQATLDVAKQFKPDLIIWDPISSYLDEGASENDAAAVRAALEAAVSIAEEANAAAIGVRHPGKDPTNLMAGSREWRAVPRSIIELLRDQGPDGSRYLSLFKHPLGERPPVRRFTIEGDKESPGMFKLADEVAAADAALAKEVTDTVQRSKVDRACELIRAYLADGEKPSNDVYRAGEAEKLGDTIMDRAAVKVGVERRREGHGREHKSYWSLPSEKPVQAVEKDHSPQEGGCQGEGRGE